MATNAENTSKNGSDSVIPYDRNRVILTPDGTRPHSTYINASFIEGYHNDESFIITQDPLEVSSIKTSGRTGRPGYDKMIILQVTKLMLIANCFPFRRLPWTSGAWS